MAKCTVIQDPLPPPPKTYMLELNEVEAAAIRALTGSVNNSGEVRDATNSIYNALRVAGVPDSSMSLGEVNGRPCFSVDSHLGWIELKPSIGSKYRN